MAPTCYSLTNERLGVYSEQSLVWSTLKAAWQKHCERLALRPNAAAIAHCLVRNTVDCNSWRITGPVIDVLWASFRVLEGAFFSKSPLLMLSLFECPLCFGWFSYRNKSHRTSLACLSSTFVTLIVPCSTFVIERTSPTLPRNLLYVPSAKYNQPGTSRKKRRFRWRDVGKVCVT